VSLKASAGIRTYEDAAALIEAGADRIGTSAGTAIMLGSQK
jgi:deoxyribose-phosphate aldolase